MCALDRTTIRQTIGRMRKIAHMTAGVLLATFASDTGTASAQDLPGDPDKGLELAATVCANCHAIEAGLMHTGASGAPSFQSIADNPTATPLALRVFLGTPHRNMPDLILTEAEREDVIAYIVDLREQ